jgi:hypothetical protein
MMQKLLRHKVMLALAVPAAAVGVAGSWHYNAGYQGRASNNSAVIRSGADLSTYVTPGSYDEVRVPIRNDSPEAVTITGLRFPDAPRIAWNGTPVLVQPGATVYLNVTTPSNCPASPHALKDKDPVDVAVRAVTMNGKTHGSLRTAVSGVIQYAADYCASPTPTP